jgi:Predicted transcriptional regulator
MDGEIMTDNVPVPVLAPEEEIILLEPGKERAQNIVKAISHQNAGELMQLLSTEGPMRLSDIANRLELSTNAAKYHVENLMNAGLIEVSNTRYSVKGKKMKVYRLKNQVFIVAPGRSSGSDLRAVLLKYATLCGVFVASFAVLLFQPFVMVIAEPAGPLSGSLQTAGELPPAYVSALPEAALVIAAIITILAFAGFELLEYWKRRQLIAG